MVSSVVSALFLASLAVVAAFQAPTTSQPRSMARQSSTAQSDRQALENSGLDLGLWPVGTAVSSACSAQATRDAPPATARITFHRW